MLKRPMILRVLSIVLAFALLFALSACSEKAAGENDGQAQAKPMADKAQGAQAAPAQKAVAEPGAKPRYTFDKTKVDLGDVTRGEKATHTFVLKNVSEHVVNIKRAKGS